MDLVDRLKGFIDRVDQVDGAVRIIDYKTGDCKPQFARIADLFDPQATSRPKEVMQVFFYGWLYAQWAGQSTIPPLQPGIYTVRNLFKEAFDASIYYKPSVKESLRVVDFSRFSASFEEALRHCLDQLFDPAIPFTQGRPAGCSYCSFKALCGR